MDKDRGNQQGTSRDELLRPDRISGSEILLRTLLLEGVDCVFGYPGGAVLYIYDAMHGNPDFNHILTRHEQGAIHAADGYARSTGKIGVCLATSGPGATNLVTGIATAFMDSIPLVVITGNVATSLIGTDSFQEADIIGITQPITKHSFFVRRVEDLAGILREAFYIAGTGRRGPVLVDIPKDVSAEMALFDYPELVPIPGYHPSPAMNMKALQQLKKALLEAERPLIVAGNGVIQSNASGELIALAERLSIPVTTTLLGLGGFPSAHPLWLGMPGMHGTYAANQALLQCDFLLSIGARFDDRVTMRLDGFAPQARIAHIDIDEAELGKLVDTVLPIVGDAKLVLEQLLASIESCPSIEREWNEKLKDMKLSYPLRYRASDVKLKPQFVIEMLAETTEGKAIVTTDVGQHQMWAAQFFGFRTPRSLITSGGLGTMGFGLPSAIGAQVGNPERMVISINGDGGMQMCAQELAICSIHQIPVKVVVINNGTLGMIKQWQEIVYNGRYSHIDLSGSPDFVLLAQAYGIRAWRATNPSEARIAWNEAMLHNGPALVDFIVDENELVYPMVPQGKSLSDMILGGD